MIGRLTSVRVGGEAGASEELVARYLEKLTAEEVFNINRAERYRLLADDLPGLDVRLSLRPAAGGAPAHAQGIQATDNVTFGGSKSTNRLAHAADRLGFGVVLHLDLVAADLFVPDAENRLALARLEVEVGAQHRIAGVAMTCLPFWYL